MRGVVYQPWKTDCACGKDAFYSQNTFLLCPGYSARLHFPATLPVKCAYVQCGMWAEMMKTKVCH